MDQIRPFSKCPAPGDWLEILTTLRPSEKLKLAAGFVWFALPFRLPLELDLHLSAQGAHQDPPGCSSFGLLPIGQTNARKTLWPESPRLAPKIKSNGSRQLYSLACAI